MGASSSIVYCVPLLKTYRLLLVKCKIPYVNCASRYSIYKLMSYELASLIKLPTGVPVGFLYFLWTFGFPSAAVEA
jgi:hypothetical protein